MTEELTDISLKKFPPHSLEAERFVLGAIFLDNKAISKAAEILSPNDFFQPAHRKIYSIMLGLFRKNEVIDLVTTQHELQRESKLEEIGGAVYLMDLMGVVPTAANVVSHARIVKDKARKRNVISLCHRLTEEAYLDRPDFNESIKNTSAELTTLTRNINADILPQLESWNHIQSLNVTIEWVVDRLIPKESITIVFGKGGIGKTWLLMDMARSVGNGIPFLGYTTLKTPVIYVDFENPLAVLNIRTQKLGNAEGVYFWRASNEQIKPPRLDSNDWAVYKRLPKGAVLIFDTLRASQDKDENASKDMGPIMGRLKELRDMGFTVIMLHHTAKNSDRIPKGSTAIVDLADHILGLTLVKKKLDGQEIVIDDDDSEENAVYRFGVCDKTRFEPYHIYLTLNPDRGFELAPDPQEDNLKEMHRILTEQGSVAKTAFLQCCRDRLSLSKGKADKLFDKGQGRYWTVTKLKEQKNTQLVTAIQFSSFPPLYSTGKLENCPELSESSPANGNIADSGKLPLNTEFASLPIPLQETGKLDLLEGEL